MICGPVLPAPELVPPSPLLAAVHGVSVPSSCTPSPWHGVHADPSGQAFHPNLCCFPHSEHAVVEVTS